MSISQVQAEGGLNPLKDSHVEQLNKKSKKSAAEVNTTANPIQEKDSVELSEQAKLFQEIDRYKKELDNIPSPNEGRLDEIKASIANGEYFTDEVMNATATRIADSMI